MVEILIVDDKSLLKVEERMLLQINKDFTISKAEDFEEGIKLAKEVNFDFIFTDVFPYSKNDEDLKNFLAVFNNKVIKICLCGAMLPESLHGLFNESINKPFTISDIRLIIDKYNLHKL